MCDFTVFLDGEIIHREVVYAKADGTQVLLRGILGAIKKVNGCRIVEVDVSSERLVLASG